VAGYYTQNFHPGHLGVDVGTYGEHLPVVTPYDALVHYGDDGLEAYSRTKTGGHRVWITFVEGPYQGWTVLVAHLLREPHSDGRVPAGSPVGHVDNTGKGSTGVHAHMELVTPIGTRVDPNNFFRLASAREVEEGARALFHKDAGQRISLTLANRVGAEHLPIAFTRHKGG